MNIRSAFARPLFGILLLNCIFSCTSGAFAQSLCPVIPQPVSAVEVDAHFRLQPQTSIQSEDVAFNRLAGFLQRQLLRYTGISSGQDLPEASNSIILALKKDMKGEAYSIRMDQNEVRIAAAGTDGMFNGIMSFLQMARTTAVKSGTATIPCWNIDDAPFYSWRGFMLDESRHFFGAEAVKQLLDWMAFYKLNRFHWHLTDAPGWRISIQSYPLLTLVGGVGNHSDPLAAAAYYTQEEIAEIVAYARERHIEVIPEIDMPGHATAANRAYPQFSGGGSEKHPEFTFNPGKEGTYAYLAGILREVDALFPSEMIHLGGDEVHFGNQQWASDPDIQELMASQKLEDLKAVEHYFFKRMADTLMQLNNKVLGWDEIAQNNLPKEETIIFWWRHDKPESLADGLERGYSVVLCPRLPYYFDFVQDSIHRVGRRWGGNFGSLKEVYSFSQENVLPVDANRKQVLGIQANLWTERVQSRARLEFMTFPRISALSEAAWNGPERKDFPRFQQKLKQHLPLFEKEGLYYFDPDDPGRHPEVIR